MSSVVISGDVSGSVTLTAPAVAGTVTVTLPSTSGVMAVGGGTITTLTTTSDITVQGLTVGRGAGAVSTNTAVGASALAGSNSGTGVNTAIGNSALITNSTGYYNTAIGAKHPANYFSALESNTTGNSNIAVGTAALGSNTTGSSNTALGFAALPLNTTASSNTAVGYQAGYANTTGERNVSLGFQAGYAATTSGYSTFLGTYSGLGTTGQRNTFIGEGSGYLVTSGAQNTILGRYNGNQGGWDIRTSSNHIVLSDGDGNPRLVLTNAGFPYCLGAYTNSGPASANMFVDSTGQIYRATSSLKYKRDIEDATHGLSDVMALRPVTYKSKREDCGETVYGGFIAEEVHALGLTEFVDYNDEGEPDAIHYGSMVSVLVKAIQEQQALITQLQADVAALKGASA